MSETTLHTDLLRFATVGSVDDGKSTLIGRLLVDTKQLFDDQLDALSVAAQRRGSADVDLSFITDGLRAEREQGITIDVAYRYAATPQRKFVIADCPGHVQYTANMATGASTADLVLMVIDATAGIKEQTRRHLCIAALLGVRQVIACANKMDLANWRQEAYDHVVEEMTSLASRLGIDSLTVIPISALAGDNVVDASAKTPYYDGPTVLEALEAAPAGGWANLHGSSEHDASRLPVQWIIRKPGGGRSYAGMVYGQALEVGAKVTVLPDGRHSQVIAIATPRGEATRAEVGISVAVDLADDLDVSRGDMIVGTDTPPEVTSELTATVCWFSPTPLTAGRRLRVKHTTRSTPALIAEILGELDVTSLHIADATELAENAIGIVRLTTASPLVVDPYSVNRITGSFVLIDEVTNITVAAGMVGPPTLHTD